MEEKHKIYRRFSSLRAQPLLLGWVRVWVLKTLFFFSSSGASSPLEPTCSPESLSFLQKWVIIGAQGHRGAWKSRCKVQAGFSTTSKPRHLTLRVALTPTLLSRSTSLGFYQPLPEAPCLQLGGKRTGKAG